MKKILTTIFILTSTLFAWQKAATEVTGKYWMYDNDDDPPFTEPDLSAYPLPDYEVLWNNGNATKISGYNDRPFRYELPDSFYYYDQWFGPGCSRRYLYISPDGWVSFDPVCDEDGFPLPPDAEPPFPSVDDPNEIIAVLWQDNDCSNPPEPALQPRIYYLYSSYYDRLYIQWYNVKARATDEKYDFELILNMGGQKLLAGNFSYHFIHFLYNDCTNSWYSDDGKAGFEDQRGEKGIYYTGNIRNGRVIRAGCFIEVECECGQWEQPQVQWNYKTNIVTCGQSNRVEQIPEITVNSRYICYPENDSSCLRPYEWMVECSRNAPGFPMNGTSATGDFSFTPSRRGIYTVAITTQCGDEACEECSFNIRVKRNWTYRP